jgi:hypothetical protein
MEVTLTCGRAKPFKAPYEIRAGEGFTLDIRKQTVKRELYLLLRRSPFCGLRLEFYSLVSKLPPVNVSVYLRR